MKRLIIVEDQVYMSDFLSEQISWEECGVKVCGVYKNGTEGLEGIKRNAPDICITDINMPKMTGLELISAVKALALDVKFIIISGHSDFHMVKGAFKLGVKDYLLKGEFEIDELTALVKKLANSKTELPMNANHFSIIRENALKSCIWGGKVPEHIHLRYFAGEKCILVLKLLNFLDIQEKEWENNSELLKYGVFNIVNEILDNYDYGEACFKNEDILVCLFSDAGGCISHVKISEIYCEICKVLHEYLDLNVTAGMADGFDGDSLILLYDNAIKALDYTFIAGKDCLVCYNTEASSSHTQFIDFAAKLESLMRYMKRNCFSEVCERFSFFFMDSCHIEQLPQLMKYLSACFYNMMEFIKLYGAQVDKEAFVSLLTDGTILQINDYFKDTLMKLSEAVANEGDVTVMIKAYIDKHYTEDLSLRTMADAYHIEYTHLSRKLAQKLGMSFVEYLTGLRMKEAFILLRESEFKICEIAQMVGYNNYENFQRNFIKTYGETPKAVRGK